MWKSSSYKLFYLLNGTYSAGLYAHENYFNNGLFLIVNTFTNITSSLTNLVTIIIISLKVTGFEKWAFLLLPPHNIRWCEASGL